MGTVAAPGGHFDVDRHFTDTKTILYLSSLEHHASPALGLDKKMLQYKIKERRRNTIFMMHNTIAES